MRWLLFMPLFVAAACNASDDQNEEPSPCGGQCYAGYPNAYPDDASMPPELSGKLTPGFSSSIAGASLERIAAADSGILTASLAGTALYVSQLDANTGAAGFTSNAIDRYPFAHVTTLTTDASGNILVAGPSATPTSSLAALRLTANGAVDTTFGTNGLASIAVPDALGGAYTVETRAVLAAASKKIIVGGTLLATAPGAPNRFCLAAFDSSGTLDPTFGESGLIVGSFGPLSSALFAILDHVNDELYVGGTVQASATTRGFAVARFYEGHLDSSFGAGGITSLVVDGELQDLAAFDGSGSLTAIGTTTTATGTAGYLAQWNAYSGEFELSQTIGLDLPSWTVGDGLVDAQGRLLLTGFAPADPDAGFGAKFFTTRLLFSNAEYPYSEYPHIVYPDESFGAASIAELPPALANDARPTSMVMRSAAQLFVGGTAGGHPFVLGYD